ncbi:MAG: hypothetical protein KAI40_07225 [Desulfobacterales bacterium]|nr:hypothetical protein [Desulfobacterales bacterium]
MKIIIGGAIAVLLGLIGIGVWFPHLIAILKGTIPIVLLLGGSLALYLGFDELKDTWKNEEGIEDDPVEDKERIADLEKELEKLKNNK